VHKGEFTFKCRSTKVIEVIAVVVKMCKPESVGNGQTLKDTLAEMEKHRKLRYHENVVGLVGTVTRNAEEQQSK